MNLFLIFYNILLDDLKNFMQRWNQPKSTIKALEDGKSPRNEPNSNSFFKWFFNIP